MPDDIPDTEPSRKPDKERKPYGTYSEPGWPGVTWAAREKRYVAYIQRKGRKKHLGYFKTFNEAMNARLRAEHDYAMGALFDD